MTIILTLDEHPFQYAIVDWLADRPVIVEGTESLDEDALCRALLDRPGNLSSASLHMLRHPAAYPLKVERYNRCPTCEQWSPCDVRKRRTGDSN